VIAAEHFVERHGLVIIIAVGESIVVWARARRGAINLRLVLVARPSPR
jgi:low temperature requirement protein LtrA